MVIKIQPPSSKVNSTLLYNERKADGTNGIREHEENCSEESGYEIITRNVPKDTTLKKEFERLQTKNAKETRGRKLLNPAFHMSINPGSNEVFDDNTIVALTDDIMEKLGYGNCPYRLYKHTDIQRTHYHVVAIRIGQDGKKINDSFENKRLIEYARTIEQKYGFVIGKDKAQTNSKTQANEQKAAISTKEWVQPFSMDSHLAISEQYIKIHEDALSWNFTTMEQYVAILRYRYNTDVVITPDTLHYVGRNKVRLRTTVPIADTILGFNAKTDIEKTINNTKSLPSRKAQKNRISKIARKCAKDAKSASDFIRALRKAGILMVLSYKENGEPFGLTWLDKTTRNAFKGSETDTGLDWLKLVAKDKGWNLYKKTKTRKARPTISPTIFRAVSKTMRKINLTNSNSHTHGTDTDSSQLKDDIYGKEHSNIKL